MMTARYGLAVLLSVCVLTRAEEILIESFDDAGNLRFNTIPHVESYRVEWSSGAGEGWMPFQAAADALDEIPPSEADSITVQVPRWYRVVATATNPPVPLYMVVDLASGPASASYPVTMLEDVPEGGWTDEYRTTKLVLRRAPAGTFTMGSPTNEVGYPGILDLTQHEVTLTQDFYIGVFQVTQKQWERVTGGLPSYFNNTTYRDTRPVEGVSYYQIRENPNNTAIAPTWPASSQVGPDSFMGRLRTRTGLAFDLPTEAQWEYACRAGTTTALNSGYDLTNSDLDPRMNEVGRYYYNQTGGASPHRGSSTSAGTAKVGSYLVNSWGLYDMHGNVNEWCLDWYEIYPGTVTDPHGPASGAVRIQRGGSWRNTSPAACRSAARHATYPHVTDSTFALNGFRVALIAP